MLLTRGKTAAVIAGLLGIFGTYLGVSWALGYIWAGIWNEGVLQNVASVTIGILCLLAWVGFLLARNVRAVYWMGTFIALVAVAVLAWDQLVGRILTLRADVLHLAFALAALILILLRGWAVESRE
jgi:hypothetical protein